MQHPKIAVLGASGLIGEAVALDLMRRRFPVVPVARKFTAAQKSTFGGAALEREIVVDPRSIGKALRERDVTVVVNCIGVLQDRSENETARAHDVFVSALIECLSIWSESPLLVHLSIPGEAERDSTTFSRSKRRAEQLISESMLPSVILRPGFVIAANTFGGSALVRALAMSPIGLNRRDAASPFGTVASAKIAQTIAQVADRFASGERHWSACWDLMGRDVPSLGDVIEEFRRHFGGPHVRATIPPWLLTLGARLGDMSARLGWSPPVRTTALTELRRGVRGSPGPWIAATGIEPEPLSVQLEALPATIQEKWFARLYLLKPLVIASLVFFWAVSGLVAISVSYDAAAAILSTHGFPPLLASAITITSSLADIMIAILIAFRRTSQFGLIAGIAVSVFYMVMAAILTPDMWIEPLGALVKTVPAIVLMLVALVTLEDR